MILCTDPILKEILEEKKINAVVFDSILTVSEKQEMLESLDQFASEWFFDHEGQDYTVYRNVSIGAVLHDEIMMLFHMLWHFVWIFDKIGEKEQITFYQSQSCKIPEVIEDLIIKGGGSVETIANSYPYLCFRMLHKSQSSGTNISLENMDMLPDTKISKSYSPEIKSKLRVVLSKLFSLFSFKKQFIYLHVLRSLVPFYRSFLSNQENSIGLNLEWNSKKNPYLDLPQMTRLENFRNIFRLNRMGVRTDIQKPPLFCKKSLKPEKDEFIKGLIDNFKEKFQSSLMNFMKNRAFCSTGILNDYFVRFYINIVPGFKIAIDYYYKIYKSKSVVGCLVEMVHPLKVQVLSNLRKKTYWVPPNFFLHNQYFSPYLIFRMGQYFRPIAVSRYDSSRYARLGFNEDNIEILDPGYFDEHRKNLKPFKSIRSVRGSKVLIIAPWIQNTNTYRQQISGWDLLYYFSDILDILEEFNVSSVQIRTVPGVHSLEMNSTHYTASDCYNYFLDVAKKNRKKPYSFEIFFSKSLLSNLVDDIQNNDIVIGPISGTIFDSLVCGRDYVVYDNSVAPYPTGKYSCLVYDGIIKKYRNKDELRAHLYQYKPIDRDFIFRKYYPTIFSRQETPENLNSCLEKMFK